MKRTIIAVGTAVLMLAGCAGGKGQGGSLVAAPIGTNVRAFTVPIGSLLQPRDGFACARVGTGSVIVAGGRTGERPATDTAEMIEPTGAVRPVLSRMSTPRRNAAAVRLDADRVLFIGGHDQDDRALASTEIYAHSKRAFFVGPLLLAPRDDAAVAVIASMIYVFGGKGQRTVEAIDMATLQTKKLRGELELDHVGAQAAASGRIVIVGGDADSSPPEAYDLDQERSIPLAFRDQVRGETLVELESSVLFVGGSGESSILTAATKEFSTDLHASPTLGVGRVHGTVVSFGGSKLVIGGHDRRTAVASTDFIHSSSTWEPGPELQTPRARCRAVALEDGRIVVVGGHNGTVGSNFRPVAQCEMILPFGAKAPTSSATLDAYTAEEIALERTIRELDRTKKALVEALARNAQLEQRVQDLIGERDAARRQIAELETQLAATRAQLAQARTDLANANAQIASLRNQLATAGGQIATLQTQLANATSNASTLQAEIARLEARARLAESALGAQSSQIANLANQLAATQSQLGATKAELEAVRAQLAAAMKNIGFTTPIVATPAAPSAGLTLAGYTPSTSPNRPRVIAVMASTISSGQQVKIYVSTYGANNVISFGGIPAGAKNTLLSSDLYNGVQTPYFVATVPAIDPKYSRVSIQLTADGVTSENFYVAFK